jgi:hypothetical protein
MSHYNFGIRKFNIIHCQLRNEASNLKAHLFNDFYLKILTVQTVVVH